MRFLPELFEIKPVVTKKAWTPNKRLSNRKSSRSGLESQWLNKVLCHADLSSFAMRERNSMFFTARFARGAKNAEFKPIFFSAERAEK